MKRIIWSESTESSESVTAASSSSHDGPECSSTLAILVAVFAFAGEAARRGRGGGLAPFAAFRAIAHQVLCVLLIGTGQLGHSIATAEDGAVND